MFIFGELFVELDRVVTLAKGSSVDKVCDLLGEHEGVSLAFHSEFLLHIAQEMTEVDVEKVSAFLIYHNIVRVTVAQTQNIRGNTVPSSRTNESIASFLQSFLPLVGVIFLHICGHKLFNGVIGECLKHRFMILNVRDRITVLNEFKVPLLTIRTEHLVWRHS